MAMDDAKAIFDDQTSLLLAKQADAVQVLGLKREKRLFDLLAGGECSYSSAKEDYQAFRRRIVTGE